MLEGMAKYEKDFKGWAKVAEEVGKGARFTRPVLVLAKFNERTVLAIPITSQPNYRRGYREIVVAGKVEFLILGQARPMDVLRLEEYIDEVARAELEGIWGAYMKLLRYHFYKKSSSVWDEPDFEGDVPASSHATIG